MPHANAARNPNLNVADQITDLEQRLDRALQDAAIYWSQADTTLRCHSEDIAKIGEMLNAEATRRDWCDEYLAFVEDLNEHLHLPLQVPPTEWRVTITYEITADFVINCNEDEISDKAEKLYEKYYEPGFNLKMPDADVKFSDSRYNWEQM
jgi:hypothetical protein